MAAILVMGALVCGAAATLDASSMAAAAARPFVSDKSRDYFGYFLPASPVKAGNFSLRNLFIGQPDDFKSFEAGKADKAFAAVMVEFEDVTSPMMTAEDGQQYHSVTIRVLPTAYSVGNGRVTFSGTDKKLGAVTFDGTLDKDFFKKPTADVPHPDDRPMLRGKLTIGGKAFTVAFNWFGGD